MEKACTFTSWTVLDTSRHGEADGNSPWLVHDLLEEVHQLMYRNLPSMGFEPQWATLARLMTLLFVMKNSFQKTPSEVLSTSGGGEAVGKAGRDLRMLPEGEKAG